jgi:hypothetical protein
MCNVQKHPNAQPSSKLKYQFHLRNFGADRIFPRLKVLMLKKLELQLLLNKQKRILKLRQGLKIKWKLILLTKGQKLVFKWFKPQKQFKKKKQLSRKYSRICISSQMELIEFFRG